MMMVIGDQQQTQEPGKVGLDKISQSSHINNDTPLYTNVIFILHAFFMEYIIYIIYFEYFEIIGKNYL